MGFPNPLNRYGRGSRPVCFFFLVLAKEVLTCNSLTVFGLVNLIDSSLRSKYLQYGVGSDKSNTVS